MTTIQIAYFDPKNLDTLTSGYHGTASLDQLLTDNAINAPTILQENEKPTPLQADALISQLVALKTHLAPKDTLQTGTLTSVAEVDLSPAELEALKGQTTIMDTLNDQTRITYKGNITDVSPSAEPPVGYPDLVEFIESLETARNEGLYAQVSYIPD